MSRGTIIGLVLLIFGSLSIASGWAQENRPGSSSGNSLAERLASLRDAMRRDDPADRSSSQPSKSHSSKQSTRKGESSKQRPDTRRNAGQSGSLLPGNLLPEAMFGRASSKQNVSHNNRPAQVSRKTTPPRAGSLLSEEFSMQANDLPANLTPRRSPPTKRESELQAALADLLPAKKVDTAEEALSAAIDGPISTPSRSRSEAINQKGAISHKGFDVYEALIGGNPEEPLTEKVAESSTTEAALPAGEPTHKKEAAKETSVDKPLLIDISNQAAEVVTEPTAIEPRLVVPNQPTVESSTKPSNPIRMNKATGATDPFQHDSEEVFDAPQRESNDSDVHRFEPQRQTHATPSSVRSQGDVLHSQRQPVIVSRIEGPRNILVGREANYQVTLHNTSNIPAEEISAIIRVPQWAEVVDATSTNGTVERGGGNVNNDGLQWHLRALDAGSSQTLHVRLIPRSGRPLQLEVQWSQAPVRTQTLVEVREPKLEMSIDGPSEVLFGKPQRFRLALRNPGSGLAEGISVRLVPPGGDPRSATFQTVGDLQPGEQREIALELTAREPGDLIIQADASAEGGLQADAVKTVLCRKPELKVDWRGPDTKYAGTIGAYYFRIRNPGNATTESVAFTVKLPRGAKFVGGSDGCRHDARTESVTWQLGGIGAQGEQFLQVRCQVSQPGENRFEISAETPDGSLRDVATFETHVVALADLKLDVSDPQGPVPLGESVAYEIRVVNRGSTAAEGVSVIGLFSEGIDPTSVEGAQYSVRDGRVSFHPIKTLPAGREVVLRIHAQAKQVGTHIFRAEVVCQDLDIKLAAEETTRFFEDEYRWEDGAAAYSAEREKTTSR